MAIVLDINPGSWTSDDWAVIMSIATLLVVIGGVYYKLMNIATEVKKISKLDIRFTKIEGRVMACEKDNISFDKTLEKLTSKIDITFDIIFTSNNYKKMGKFNEKNAGVAANKVKVSSVEIAKIKSKGFKIMTKEEIESLRPDCYPVLELHI